MLLLFISALESEDDMEEEYREAGYIERTPVTFEWPPGAPPIGEEEISWLKKYGPWLLGGTAIVLATIALSKK